MSKMSDRIADIEEVGLTAQGRNELIAHFGGEPLILSRAAKAKCYECSGYYQDGKVDCGITDCPLHPFMPYNPKRTKRVSTMSDEQKRVVSERMRKVGAAKKQTSDSMS